MFCGCKVHFSRLAAYLDGGPACASVGALTLRAGLAHVPLGPNSSFIHHTPHNIGASPPFLLSYQINKTTKNHNHSRTYRRTPITRYKNCQIENLARFSAPLDRIWKNFSQKVPFFENFKSKTVTFKKLNDCNFSWRFFPFPK